MLFDINSLVQIPLLGVVIGMAICFYRLLKGPSMADRVVALDLVASLLISAITLFSIVNKQPIYIDVVIALALIIFLGTVAFAKLIGANKIRFARGDN